MVARRSEPADRAADNELKLRRYPTSAAKKLTTEDTSALSHHRYSRRTVGRRWGKERRRGSRPSVALVPAVEGGEVACLPGLAQARGAEVPVRAGFAHRHLEVAPQVVERGAAPEPVAVVDAVDDQA